MKIILRTRNKKVAEFKLNSMQNEGKRGKIKYTRADKEYRAYEL